MRMSRNASAIKVHAGLILPSIDVMGKTATYLFTEIEDINGKWDDSFNVNQGYYLIHDGKYHHVYKVKPICYKCKKEANYYDLAKDKPVCVTCWNNKEVEARSIQSQEEQFENAMTHEADKIQEDFEESFKDLEDDESDDSCQE